MKKFYFLALAAALSLSAVAGTPDGLRGERLAKSAKADAAPALTVKKAKSHSFAAPAAKAAAEATLAGSYTITLGDWYFEDSINGEFEADCTVTLDGDVACISCEYFPSDVYADYNATTGTLSFTSEKLGEDNSDGTTVYVQFEPYQYDYNAQDCVVTNFEATFNAATGTISFPEEHGFQWTAYEDAEYTTVIGYYNILDVVSMEKYDPNADPNEGWTSLGEATLMDGWLLPAFGIDQTKEANWYKVELQQSDLDKNIYRLVDPYKGKCPVAKYNESTRTGYIQFDVTDPDHVTFAAVDAGFAMAELEVSRFYCTDVLSSLAGEYNEDPAEVVEMYGDELPYTTFEDGVVSLTSMTVDGEIVNTACFGDQTSPYALFSWTDEDDNTLDMATKIFFPSNAGIEGVTVDAATATVEYFNLQGMRVANPEAGLYIRRQGGKAVKVVKF